MFTLSNQLMFLYFFQSGFYLVINLLTYLPIYLPIYLPFHLFIYLLVYSFSYSFVQPFIHPSIHPPSYRPTYILIYVNNCFFISIGVLTPFFLQIKSILLLSFRPLSANKNSPNYQKIFTAPHAGEKDF